MGKAKDIDRKRAEWMFVEQGQFQKEIAALLEVSEKTVGRWASEGCWKEKRQARMSSKKEMVETTQSVVTRIAENISSAEEEPTIKDLKTLTTAVKTLKEIEGSINFHDSCEVIQNFIKFVSRVEPKQVHRLTELADGFLKDILRYENK